MLRRGQIILIVLTTTIFSCKNDRSYSYAIKDFRKALQPYLVEIITTGMVMHYDIGLRYVSTDKELVELTQSEHPLLRASAFKEIYKRKSLNYFDILMNHI